jgi:hypothetical protein
MISDGIFIIGSALSAKGMLSIYDDDARFSQLEKTISSINWYCPKSIKILFDASPELDKRKFEHLNRLGIRTIHTGADPWIAELSRTTRKSEGEVMSVLKVLDHIKSSGISAKRIYKISGRYRLNKNFKLGLEHTNKIVFARSNSSWYGYSRDINELTEIGADRYYQTRLWHADYSLLDNLIDTLNVIAKDCDTYSIDLEHSFYKSFHRQNVLELDKIGVCGNIAPSGMYIDE